VKAIVVHEYGSPDVLKYEDIADPEPRAGEIRVKVGAATVNRVLDVALRAGTQAHRKPTFPFIPGVDCAGVVDKIGPGVTRWKVGDRVAAAGRMPLDSAPEDWALDAKEGYSGPTGMMGIKRPGGFAEKVCVAACVCFRVPEAVSFPEAAVLLRHAPTAWNLLFNVAELKASEWALIMGAGGNLGSIGIQIAKHVIGATVIATAGSDDRAQGALALGADFAVNYNTHNLRDEVLRLTDGKGVNVLYDNIANPKVLPDAFHALGDRGRLVTAGAHGGPNVMIDFFHLYDHKITIKGQPGYKTTDVPKCLDAAAQGKLKVKIAHILPLKDAAQAHRMMEGDPGMGKIVLSPTL
jgi:NADPH2:quinone reductase